MSGLDYRSSALTIDPHSGLVQPGRFVASPNFDERPEHSSQASSDLGYPGTEGMGLETMGPESVGPETEGPEHMGIDVLVIHAISLPPNCYGGTFIEDLFTNRLDPKAHSYFADIAHLRVSAHFLIHRSGRLTQFVPTGKRAWHAGVSNFRGREQVNDFSIGIELEGCDDDPFEDAQYHTLVDLTQCLVMAYPSITRDCIVGHSDIAPGRKTDPGPHFDWDRYLNRISFTGTKEP